jgi:hypothetical protein
MQYKTIALGLIQENPTLHDQLHASKTLLPTLNRYAEELKTRHEAWKEQLGQARPVSDPSQIASEAMELATAELQDRLSSESPTDESEALSLDAAMNFLRRHSPPA